MRLALLLPVLFSVAALACPEGARAEPRDQAL
jgi:hypothetical protein